uniref:Ubiquitin n=1 Tax=Solanum tuberosum TaxID=4113 RepID=M1AL35_SOLTU
MGPINFTRVRVALRATKENNEEPSQSKMFIATRTKTGKKIQADTKVAIAELQNRQNSGETADDSFRAMFRKEQPGRLRSNLVSPVDASSAQAVRGQNLPHFSGSTHDSVLQKVFCVVPSILCLSWCLGVLVSSVECLGFVGVEFALFPCFVGATAILIYGTPLWSTVY